MRGGVINVVEAVEAVEDNRGDEGLVAGNLISVLVRCRATAVTAVDRYERTASETSSSRTSKLSLKINGPHSILRIAIHSS